MADDPVGAAAIVAMEVQLDTLRDEERTYRASQREQLAEAAAARAVADQSESIISQRSASLTQLIGLTSQYNTLVDAVGAAQDDHDFLRAKAAEARLKESQSREIGALQVVEPAFLPGAPANPPVARLILLAAVVSLLLGVVVVLLLEVARPG